MCWKVTDKIGNFLLGCYARQTPVLDLGDFYTGRLKAYGVARSPFGVVKRRFWADVQGAPEGDTLVLNENFTYDDGRKFNREWRMNRYGPEGKNYTGIGGDIEGDIIGETRGAAALLRYTLKVPVKGKPNSFKFIPVTHWQHLIDEKHTMHFITLKRFGLPLLKSTVMFEKLT